MSNQRVLIVAHGHPDINKGGAEIAAYNMYQEMQRQGQDVYFLARTGQAPHGGAAFSSRNSDKEILFHTTHDDWFLFSNIKTRHIWQEFRDLLLQIKPDIVHFHHYFLLGIEMLEEVRRTLPDCKIVLTLHEFLAICANKGLMYKTSGKLCYQASARDCHECLPEHQPGDFFLREQYIKRIFKNVDQFISPSAFLKQRYVEWGLADGIIEVIENGQPDNVKDEALQVIQISNKKIVFAFFGQINPFKGIDIVIEAFNLLPKRLQKLARLDIHGANLEHQKGEYKNKVTKLLESSGNNVRFLGSYEPHEMPKLLAVTDIAIVPSIWWENSPMVIQEAFNANTPLLVSDIGGMAEKVKHGVNGLHFRAGSPHDLAELMQEIIENETLLKTLKASINPPLSIEECVSLHNDLYSS